MKTVYIPTNLDLERLTTTYPPKFKFHLDEFKYLIGTIVKLKVEIKANTDEVNSNYVNLHSQILQPRIRQYNRFLSYLVDHGVIQKDYYIPKEKATGYKLSEQYATTGFKAELLTKRTLIKKRVPEITRQRTIQKEYGHLSKWLDRGLQIHYNEAVSCLKMLYEKDKKANKPHPLEKYHLRKLSIDKIHAGDFSFSVDDTSRRVHTNLTNMKSELRNFLHYQGRKLCSVDVKNSQPFISTVLFNPAFYEKDASFNLFNISSSLYNKIQPIIINIQSLLPNISSPIMLVKKDETHAHSDFELYCTLVDKGKLYPYLASKSLYITGKNYDLGNPDEKRALKNLFFYNLYSDNRMRPGDEASGFRKLFRECFPNVYNVFALLKKGDKRTLPIILQSIESQIIISGVTRALGKEYPDLPIYTIHDSVVTLDENADLVKNKLKQEFQEAIGLEPSLQPEFWHPTKINDTLFKHPDLVESQMKKEQYAEHLMLQQ